MPDAWTRLILDIYKATESLQKNPEHLYDILIVCLFLTEKSNIAYLKYFK